VNVDEVQYTPGLSRHLKSAIDRDRHTTGRYILAGSQHLTRMKGVSDSLAGRAWPAAGISNSDEFESLPVLLPAGMGDGEVLDLVVQGAAGDPQ